jgi:hypothetical protein
MSELEKGLPGMKYSEGAPAVPVSISRSRTVYLPAGSLISWPSARGPGAALELTAAVLPCATRGPGLRWLVSEQAAGWTLPHPRQSRVPPGHACVQARTRAALRGARRC